MLMDLFFDAIPIKRKQRIHFHRFVESIHHQLNRTSGIKNLCGTLLKHGLITLMSYVLMSFTYRILLMRYYSPVYCTALSKTMSSLSLRLIVIPKPYITSNCHPQALYKDGLQRERFIPAIELIETIMKVISVNGEVDHRVDNSALLSLLPFYLNLNDSGNKKLKDNDLIDLNLDHEKKAQTSISSHFRQLAHALPSHGYLNVNNRKIEFLGRTKDIVWFDFSMICDGPLNQLGYISLANDFSTILVNNVPQFKGEDIQQVAQGTEENYQRSLLGLEKMQITDDIARRFIALVDELYDRHLRLIVTDECDVAELYLGKQFSFKFKRCHSRLIEMQSL